MMKNFPTIYVINLKRTPERRLFVQRQLDAFGLNYQFVDAIDKYDLESSEYRTWIARLLDIDRSNLEYKYSKLALKSKTNRRRNSEGLGRIACLLSHVKTYNLILKNNDDIACVIEDDAVLLPTFPEVLATASEFSWDILMLSSHSRTIRKILENYNGMYRCLMKINSYNYMLLARCRTGKKQETHKRVVELFDFTSRFPEQSKAIEKILVEFNDAYKNMIELYNPMRRLVWLLSPTKPELINLYKELTAYIEIQLGAVPSKHRRQAIGSHHCIAEPAEKPTSTMAYLINQTGVREWRAKAVAHNTLQIDGIPWPLYTDRRVCLRLVSLPCVITSRAYARYSVRSI